MILRLSNPEEFKVKRATIANISDNIVKLSVIYGFYVTWRTKSISSAKRIFTREFGKGAIWIEYQLYEEEMKP
jgi:hypothetical protein